MPDADNTAVCLRPRRVPGPGKPGAALCQLRLRLSTHARCWQHQRVPSSTMCSRGWQPRRDASSTSSPSWRTTTSTPLRPRLTRRLFAPAAPRRLPRHRLPRLDIDHGILRTATSTTDPPPTLSATSTNGTKGYRLLEQPCRFSLQPQLHDASTVTTVGGCPSACLRILLQSHRLRRSRCDYGEMLSILIIRKD